MCPNSINQNKPVSRFQPWLKLSAALFLLGLFVQSIIPWITHLPVISTLIESNHTQGIDASGLFYTDTREVAQAENYLRNREIQQ